MYHAYVFLPNMSYEKCLETSHAWFVSKMSPHKYCSDRPDFWSEHTFGSQDALNGKEERKT